MKKRYIGLAIDKLNSLLKVYGKGSKKNDAIITDLTDIKNLVEKHLSLIERTIEDKKVIREKRYTGIV